MNDEKLDRLVADGWKVGTVAEFLELSPEQMQIKWSVFANQDRVGSPKILVGFSVVVNDLLPEVLISDI